MAGTIISRLAEEYSQLYLNPDTEPKEHYKDVILRGMECEKTSLDWYRSDPRDKDEIIETPVGRVRVITFYIRSDFEYFLRSMMSVKNGPESPIPESQGAATITAFNWPRINAHHIQFIEEEFAAGNLCPDWSEEWKKFSSVKDNYIDELVVLSVGPYSAIDEKSAGLDRDKWMELSYIIRKDHELTHVICRKLYPDQIDPVWDELTADAIGLYAAFGKYDPSLAKLFLGIEGDTYAGGRLENYVEHPEDYVSSVNSEISRIAQVSCNYHDQDPFGLIPLIQSVKNI